MGNIQAVQRKKVYLHKSDKMFTTEKKSGRKIYVLKGHILLRKCISERSSVSAHPNCEIKR